MIEMQTKQTQQTRPKPSNGAQSNYAPTQPHLQALNHRLIDLLGDDYAIELDDPHNFVHEGKPFIRFENRCVYYSHNDKHFDKNPSGWVGVSPTDGQIISGCWVCRRPQIIKHQGEYQPAPTLLTLSCNDKRLLKVLVAFDCEEVKEVNGREQPAVAFPVIYADGSAGKHYRVALEGRNKWLHKEGGKAGEAVFALHRKGIQGRIRKKRFVIVTESPLDALVLIAVGKPAIAVLGKGNANALACDQHRETLLGLLGDNGVIYVWVEPDAADFAEKVANALQRPVKVITPPDFAKDAFRLWLACEKDWDRFKAEIDRLIANATEIAPQPEPASEFDSQDTIVRVTFPPQIRKKVTDIQPLEFEWLVKEYIPIGVVTLLAGAGGHGKTSLLCDLAASIVKGGKWLNKFEVPQGGVILIVTEDPAGIRDKLFSYGVNSEDDPLLIYDLTEWEEGSEEEYKPIKAAKALPAILQDAKEVLGNIPIRLVGLDCLRGFGFDEAQASRKKKSDRLPTVREIYKPLAKFAEKEGCAVIVTHHFRKLQTEDLKSLKPKRKKGKEVAPEIDKDLLVSLVAGTAETVNAARQALVVIGDKEAGVGIIVPVKSNRSVVLGAPIRYDFYAETPTFLEFLDEEETAIETAIAFLRRVLSKGEIPSNELEALAKKEGISHRTYWRARQRLGVKAKKVFVDGKQVWFSYLPNQTNQTDPQDSPTDQPAGDGSLPTNPDNTPNFGSLGSLGEKPKQNLGFPRLPTEEAFGSLGSLGSVPASVEDCQDCQAQNHWQSTLAVSESPINTGVFEQDCQDCQTSGNLETRPEGDLQGDPPDQPANKTRPEGDPLTTFSPPDRPQGYPTPQGSPNQSEGDPLWLVFDSVLPELVVGCPPVNEPTKEPDPQPTDRPEPEGSPPANDLQAAQPEPEIEFIQINSIAKTETEEIPPTSPDDDKPPETPNNNGHGGGIGGFAPPVAPAIPPESQTRMTERLPDGSVKLSWQRKTETVAPDDLKGWQPIETIPEISLPDIESVEIPPVVVLDLETDGLDPAKWSISAAGLALYLNGKEVETLIIANKGNEADLLAQTFDYLRETCNKLGNVILTGYNIADFDLPYMIERARKLKVECPFRYLKDRETGEIKRWKVAATEGTLRGDPLDYPAIATDLPIKVIDTLHLVCRWDYTAKALRNYDLKSVAAYFNVNQPDRPILSPDQIRHAFQHDPKTFEAYLMADLRETYALFETHIKPYAGVAALTKLPIDQVATRSTAWVWEQILERHYKEIPQPDEKRKYEGGLVVSRKGLWFPCLKVDIASLYPTIMLAYRIHSRKDTDQIALRWLKTLTRQRLELKAKAKAGDANAQILQEAMKILLNSLYGFYGTGGYGFNDMGAAAKVTEVGRKVLTLMIEAVEDAGGLVVEADTDGLIICHANADPQQILNAITAAIPPVFKVEVEWQEAVCFVSDDKSYIVLPKEGDPIIKGSKWRGRDKEAYLTQAIPTFVRLWALEGKDAALAFALQTLNEIRTGQGWRWVVRSHRVGKGDKFLIDAGFKVGEIATYAYKDRKRKIVAKSETEGYDCGYYAKEFSDLVKEVIEAIDPAQIEAWREIVSQQARPLIFATN